MIKKTYVRVITLLLVALMILGVMAPAFTSYAASSLSVVNNSPSVVDVTGTPDGKDLKSGKYYFTVKDDSTLYVSASTTGQGTEVLKNCTSSKTATYGGLTFTRAGGSNWAIGDEFNITVTSVTSSEGEAQIIASNITGSSRITKGRSITIDATILDISHTFGDGENPDDVVDNEYVSFKQGDFKRGTASGDTVVSVTKGAGNKLQLVIQMKDLVYTGSGDTVEFVVGYTINGEEYTHNMSMKIPGCIPYVDKDDPEEDDEDVNLDPLIPHIIVSQYDYGTTQVSAGQVIDLNLSFENTSTQYDLDNIVMKITTPDGFSITSSSNTYHFDHLDVGESISKTISMQANPNAEAQSYAINIEFSFQYIANDTRKSGESSESISIPVTQPDRFSVDEIQVPTSLYVGDEYNLSINFVNKGKTQVYNVTAELRGNMQNSGERSFIGNVASGAEESADFYVTPTEAGKMEGEVVISYEDASMNVREVTRPFTIMVEEMPYVDPGIDFPVVDPQPTEEPSLFTVQNVVLFVVAAGVAGATGYMTVLKIKAKRSEFDDEDL